MILRSELVKLLVCPRCKWELDYREGEGRLLCAKCRLAYEVKDGIPVMLVEEAKAY
jgi:uncharacterized protein